MKIKIAHSLKDLPRVDYRTLVPLQGSLKDLTDTAYKKLKNSLKGEGFFVPFFVWRDPSDNEVYVMDGHQRLTVMKGEGVHTDNSEAPFDFPCVYIDAPTKERAAEKLLIITSKFGKVTQEGWDWFQDTFEIDADFVVDFTDFDVFVGGNGDEEEGTDSDLPDYSAKNKEIDVDGFEDKCTLKLEYTMEEYHMVKAALNKVAQTPEAAVWTLLNLPNNG